MSREIKLALTEINEHKRDSDVELHPNYENNHVYLINGISHKKLGYKSVTTFLEKFFEKFDAKKIIEKYYDWWQENEHPKYYGKSKEEIALSWKNYGQMCRNEGTKIHELFEIETNRDVVIKDTKLQIKKLKKLKIGSSGEEIKKIDKKIIKFKNKIKNHQTTQIRINAEFEEGVLFTGWYKKEVSEPFRTEYTVYGEEERIIGNIDFIYLNKCGELCIVDYKRTNLPNDNSYGKKCIGINLPDTKKSKHLLQLNIYKYLLEEYYGLEIKHLYNLYIKNNDCNFVEQKIININKLFNEEKINDC